MKVFEYKGKLGHEDPHEFNCEFCGCTDFERLQGCEKCVSFYEGSFVCTNCGSEHDYCSDSFRKTTIQMELF